MDKIKHIYRKIDCELLYNKFYLIVKSVLFIVFLFTTYYILVDMVGTQLMDNIYPTRGMLFGSKQYILLSIMAFLIFFFLLSRLFAKICLWNCKIEIGVITIYFLLCLAASYYFANYGLSEIGVVNEISDTIAGKGLCSNESMEFLSRYSYLRPVICFASIFAKGGKALKSVYICIGMTIGLYASLEFLKEIECSPKDLIICSFFFYICVPVYLSCSIFYNYSVVFWIPITILLLYLKIEKQPKLVVLYILLVGISAIGISIFPVISVPVIAICIDSFLKKRKEMILGILLAILLSTAMNNLSYKIVDNKIYNTPELQEICKKNEIPMLESTLYVSLNPDSLGFYTDDDLNYIRNLNSNDNRKNILRSNIKQRITELNYGIIDFALKKSSIAFGQGTFYSEAVSNKRLLVQRDIIRYFSSQFTEVKYYRSFYCAQNIILLSLMLILLVINKNSKYNIIFLTILGIWMVSMISETDSRHMLPFLPLFFVMASGTLGNVMTKESKSLSRE